MARPNATPASAFQCSYDLRASASQLSRNATTHAGDSMHSRLSLPVSLRKQTVRSEQRPRPGDGGSRC